MKTWSVGSMEIRIYGLCVALGVLAALLWLSRRTRDTWKPGTVSRFALLALPLGFLFARLGICLVSQGWYLFRSDFFFNFSRGGFMLYGAMAGCVLAAWITARATEQSFPVLLDGIAAPGMLAIACCRFAEGLIGVGYGRPIYDWFDPWAEQSFFPLEEPDFFLRFPFGIPNYYDEYCWSVFLLEGIAALIFTLILANKKAQAPGLFLLGLILYAGAQTVFESLRADSIPKWGFVRVNQILSGVALVLALGLCSRRLLEKGEKIPWGAWAGTAACMGVILAMEFAVEKKIHFLRWMRMDLCYFVMALASLGLILLGVRVWKRAWEIPESAIAPKATREAPIAR